MISFDTLQALWYRSQNPQVVTQEATTEDWNKEIEILYKSGIGMEDAIRFLYHERPDWLTFERWLNDKRKDNHTAAVINNEEVLSQNDLAFWNENGYVIVREAISPKDCEATQQAIWDFLRMDAHNKATWYRGHEELRGLMLNFSDHETLNRNRFAPRIRMAYEQLYQSKNIYKTIDKVSFNPPETDTFKFMGSQLHWDVSLKQPVPFALQGLLYLTDCGPDDGAFHCVPGFHHQLADWMRQLQPHENPRQKALETLQPKAIVANAGDFIIWQNTLPHCASANRGTSPRMVQYLSYLPDDYVANEEWV